MRDDAAHREALMRGVCCGRCGKAARIGPCDCGPRYESEPVAPNQLDAAIRERLDDGRDGDAIRAVLDKHGPRIISTDDEWPYCWACSGIAGERVWSPCSTRLTIATALGIVVADA